MRRFAFALVAAAALLSFCLPRQAFALNEKLPCENFMKNADGTWTVLRTTFVQGPDIKVQDGSIMRPGYLILGYDIADIIAKACPNAQIGPPPEAAAPVQAGQSAPAQSMLAKYADANGNLDVRQLTCGHLADTSGEEAQLLLAWYSGWYYGSEKKRGINLPRVRYNTRAVVDYCRANRDKKLSDVMDLMLK